MEGVGHAVLHMSCWVALRVCVALLTVLGWMVAGSRCLSSEKKYGPPVICEQCKLKCAFERPQNQKEKVGVCVCVCVCVWCVW